MTTATAKLEEAEGKLTQAEEKGEGLVTRAELDRRVALARRRSSRVLRVTVALVALIAVCALAGVAYVVPLATQAQVDTATNTSSIDALKLARDEAIRAGVPADQLPTLPMPGQGDGTDIARASSALVLANLKNNPAYRGQAGIPGPGCPASNPACRGASGTPGVPGTPGQAGAAGQPGVAGQPGAPGQSITGQPGTNGIDGQNGQDGVDGQNGEPAAMPVSAEFVGDLDNCVYRTTYQKADGSTFPVDASTPGENCF